MVARREPPFVSLPSPASLTEDRVIAEAPMAIGQTRQTFVHLVRVAQLEPAINRCLAVVQAHRFTVTGVSRTLVGQVESVTFFTDHGALGACLTYTSDTNLFPGM